MRRTRALGVVAIVLALSACGGGGGSASDGASEGTGGDGSSGDERAAATATWLGGLVLGGSVVYDVTIAGSAEPRRVVMQVQSIERRGEGIAVKLAPVGTPLDDEPVFARWLVGDSHALYMLEETVGLTEPGYVPIDAEGHLLTEAADSVQWRVSRDWLVPGAVVPGAEVASGWSLSERVASISAPVSAQPCVRLDRTEATGERGALLVCADIGLVELSRSDAAGAAQERWALREVSATTEGAVPRQPGSTDASTTGAPE